MKMPRISYPWFFAYQMCIYTYTIYTYCKIAFRIMCSYIWCKVFFFVICEYLSHISQYFNQNFILVSFSMCYFPRIQYKLHCIVVIDLGSNLVKKLYMQAEKKREIFHILYMYTNTRHNVTQCCRSASHKSFVQKKLYASVISYLYNICIIYWCI